MQNLYRCCNHCLHCWFGLLLSSLQDPVVLIGHGLHTVLPPQISLRMEEIGKNCGWFGSWTGPETAPPGSVDGTAPCPGALAQGGP